MRSSSRHSRGFSLVEVMISIAMVVLLMIGVVKVFQYTANTISSGLAVSEVNRAQRAGLTAFPVDVSGFQRLDSSVTSNDASPALIINCGKNDPLTAGGARFLDKKAEDDYVAAYGSTGAAMPGTSTAAEISKYTFRQDTLGFFARGGFRRQTANRGSLAADSGMACALAWIWYGHLWLPDNSSAFAVGAPPPTYPGQGSATTNPNNFYARQWALGRVIIGLRNLNYPLIPPYTSIAAGPTVQDFIRVLPGGSATMQPLASGSASTTTWDTGTSYTIEQSRYDLAGMDASALAAPLTPDPFGYFRERTDSTATFSGTFVPTWWTSLIYRFQANPYPTKPFIPSALGITGGSSKMAQTAPIFLPNCSDFIVEFAGDFGTQDATDTIGARTTTPDGVIDFDYDIVTKVTKTHWYGLGNTVSMKYSAPADFERTNTPTNYACAWGGESALATLSAGVAPRPRMLRITCTLNDPAGRMPDGQKFEYIVVLNDTY